MLTDRYRSAVNGTVVRADCRLKPTSACGVLFGVWRQSFRYLKSSFSENQILCCFVFFVLL